MLYIGAVKIHTTKNLKKNLGTNKSGVSPHLQYYAAGDGHCRWLSTRTTYSTTLVRMFLVPARLS